ncbi:cupin domain-containing protein [Hymenobacter sp. BT188]|uniref:cupin domain-containing protein n=1 Tax=Hymenobacter sp. BT188 TaxID=2763504 RepID=UPI0016514360|nr:cupin domain-containing protein [Hymenobacter sp. BT188]MBC6608825.1 cupin domain-containing protein [Hymenobacter sp. BT188]
MNTFLSLAAGLTLAVLPACTTDSAADDQAASQANPKASSRPAPAPAAAASQLKGFHTNIERATLANRSFRRVLYTGGHLQLVLMSLKPGEEIGSEVHKNHDQFFRVEGGSGQCVINGHSYEVTDGDVIIAPAGSTHNVINTNAAKPLQLYTLYAPPQHRNGVVQATRQEAAQHEAPFDGNTSE